MQWLCRPLRKGSVSGRKKLPCLASFRALGYAYAFAGRNIDVICRIFPGSPALTTGAHMGQLSSRGFALDDLFLWRKLMSASKIAPRCCSYLINIHDVASTTPGQGITPQNLELGESILERDYR